MPYANRIVFWFSVLAVFVFLASVRLQFSELSHGDEFSDANVMNAGENFARFGFVKSSFLPVFEPGLEKPALAYTHYPPLADIINGLLRIVFRDGALFPYRMVSVLLSFVTLVLWYLFIREFSGSVFFASLCVWFYLTNPLFIFGIDSLHECCYSELFRAAGFLALAAFLKRSGLKEFLALWTVLALLASVSFEYHVYMAVFFILWRFLDKGIPALSVKQMLWLLSAFIFSFLLHLFQNAWYFKSFLLAVSDLTSTLNARMFPVAMLNPAGIWEYSRMVILNNFRLVLVFDYPWILLFAFLSALLYRRIRSAQSVCCPVSGECAVSGTDAGLALGRVFRLFLLFGICGISWYLFFPWHSWHHFRLKFLARHLVPFASVGFALCVYIIFKYFLCVFSSRIYANLALGAMLLLVAFNGIAASELPLTQNRIEREISLIRFKGCLQSLRSISSDSDVVGVNYFRYPFMRYYSGRRFVRVFDADTLLKLQELPEYFIFFPYIGKGTFDLARSLEKEYDFLWQCPSSVFPGMFFKRKK